LTRWNAIRRIAFPTSILCLAIAFYALADNHFKPFVETFPRGSINWDSGFFYGIGIGYPHLNGGSKARALKVAQAGALSSILQVASRIRLDDRSTLEDLEREKVIIQLKAFIHYEPHEQQYMEEATPPYFRVVYRAPMKGVKGLTQKILQYLESKPAPAPTLKTGEGMALDDEALPWLILDARVFEGQSVVQPAVFPKILSQGGEVLYDISRVEEEALIKRGMARYVMTDRSPEELAYGKESKTLFSLNRLFSPATAQAEEKQKKKKRGRYIVTHVAQAQGIQKTNLVISESDAKKIKAEDVSSKVLKRCRVIVIVSSSIGGIEGRLLDRMALSLATCP
jgi:hypothetical protein